MLRTSPSGSHALVCAATTLFLAGCANFATTALPSSHATRLANGMIHGGQQPIEGPHVYLYAETTSGYGNAATSLLTAGAGTTADGSGNYYVTTAADGSFYYGGEYTCTAGTQVYLLASGGNPGIPGGAQNTAIALSAALGDCANLTSSTFTFIDEATTVAMAYALNPFLGDATHLGTRSLNIAGLNAGFATVNKLVNNTTGTALATTPAGNGAAPQLYINTLANIISACVNTSAANSSPCTQRFTYATPTSSTAPTDTLSAMNNIAAFPSAQTANLYSLSSSMAPFQPSLNAQPNDFALGITYTPSVSVNKAGAVVIDASGNLWVANCQSCLTAAATDSMVEFAPDGTLLHSYSNAGIHNTQGLAIDATGTYIYSLNQAVGVYTQDELTKMSTTSGAVQAGFPLAFSSGTYGANTFSGIAVDNSGEIWATATNAGAVVEVTPSGTLINGSPLFVGGTTGVATDNVGNIWFAGTSGNDILLFDTNGNFLQNHTPFGLDQPLNVAINGSNEVLTLNAGKGSLSKIESFNGSNGSSSPYTSIGLFRATVIAVDGANQILIPNCRASCPSSGSSLPDNLLRLSQGGHSQHGQRRLQLRGADPWLQRRFRRGN